MDTIYDQMGNSACYACYSLNTEERQRSSSGGVYPLLAREIIKDGGVVFAACYDESLNVVHRKLETVSDIPASQGSKYVASKLNDTFSAVGEEAKEKRVLFVGTPCQCAGLISYLDHNKCNRENVVIVDCVCHGVPSRLAWEEYKKSIKNTRGELKSVNMRDKSSGWSKGNYSWRETMEDGTTIVTPRREVSFMKGMLANIYLRPSCCSCRFKGVDRNTDLTLGDYWGVWIHDPEMDDDMGTSLLFVHTEKGKTLFHSIQNQIKARQIEIENAVRGNSCIVRSTPYNPKRELFFSRVENGENFISIVDDMTKEPITIRSKRMIKRIAKKILGGGVSDTCAAEPFSEVAA